MVDAHGSFLRLGSYNLGRPARGRHHKDVGVRRPAGPAAFRGMFMAATLLLLIAAGYTSILIVQRQQSLQAISRYNVTWLISQAALEVARLQAIAGASAIADGGVGPEKVQLWLDIVANRVRLLDSGETRDFLRGSPELKSIHDDFEETIAGLQPLVDHLDAAGNVRTLVHRLGRLNPGLAQLAAAANTHAGEQVAEDLTELGRLHWIFSGVLIALIVGSAGLIGILWWSNRLLIKAHAEVNGLVVSLERTTDELSRANTRAMQAMEEVQLQNRILQTQDGELHTQNARFDAALNNMSQALCMVDGNQHLIVCNIRFLEMFGLSHGTARPGTPMPDVYRAIAAIGRYDLNLISAIQDAQGELVSAHKPGRLLREISAGPAISVSHQPMTAGGWVATYEDMTERRQAEARIDFMAHHDALTKLPNRVLFHDRMAELLLKRQSGDEFLAVLCLDLDFFKNVNDSLGHPAGDRLLEAVSERLRLSVRGTDVVARLGGDEFAILRLSGGQPDQVERLAQRIVGALSEPYELDGNRAVISVSIGIALATDANATADVLLKNADMALYRAKAEGRGTYRFFAVEMDAQIQARRSMELELREALGRRQLEVFYQPIIDLHAEGVSGFEALLRWRHPLLGMISPTQFVPLAEELGLIVPIGEWVFHEAFREAATWPDHLKVAVNLSPMQFRSENLVPAIEQALTLAGLLANRVEFEITETALLENNDAVLAILHRLRELGLRTALDDFGTGYSSLSYLRSFPFDKLKIDQSFVREMAFRSDCRIIVNSVADLARRLGIVTTAEGVETPEQLEQVRAAGCAEAQGYLFDAALPANEIRNWFSPGFAKSSFRILGRIDGLNPGKHESQGDDDHSPHQHPWLSRVAQAGVLPDQVLGPMPLAGLPGHLGYAPNVTGVPTVERRTRPGISARAIS